VDALSDGGKADLGGVVEKHKKTVASRLKTLFPSLSGNKAEVVVNRSTKWLRAHKSAAVAAYTAMPMKVENNCVAVESALTAELVQAINTMANATQAGFQTVIDHMQNAAAGPQAVKPTMTA
jgi:hypothetical protein